MKILLKMRILFSALGVALLLCGCSAEEMERLLGLDKPKIRQKHRHNPQARSQPFRSLFSDQALSPLLLYG